MPQRDDNLAIWEQVQTTPGEAAKAFDTGNYKGTSANPTFNAMRATQLFGPYGIGWRVEIEKDELNNLGTDDKPHYVHTIRIALHYHYDGKDGVARGYGQTPASYMTKSGYLKVDDDYAKKSMTDAMSKALQLLGFSADIWLGMWDDVKYVQERREEWKEAKKNGSGKPKNGGYQDKFIKPQPGNEQSGNDEPPPDMDEDGPPPPDPDEPEYDPETVEVKDDGSMTVILQNNNKVGVANIEEASQEIAAVLKQDDVGWFESEQVLGANDEIIRSMPKAWQTKLTNMADAKKAAEAASSPL